VLLLHICTAMAWIWTTYLYSQFYVALSLTAVTRHNIACQQHGETHPSHSDCCFSLTATPLEFHRQKRREYLVANHYFFQLVTIFPFHLSYVNFSIDTDSLLNKPINHPIARVNQTVAVAYFNICIRVFISTAVCFSSLCCLLTNVLLSTREGRLS
jgi:hypothetical protein